MKVLAFSDLHCDVEAAEAIVDASRDADVIVGAGDFGSLRRNLHLTIDILRSIDRPTILVPGNNESMNELMEACRQWKGVRLLHGSGTKIADVDFFGLGGGIPVTPFGDWSYDFTESQGQQLLADCPRGAILISHSPPLGILDLTSGGKHVGSSAVRHAVQQRQLTMVICGHVHPCAGRHEHFGSTVVLNAGPQGVLWPLPPPNRLMDADPEDE